MLYPQLNEARALLDLSGVWQFALGNEEFDEEKMLFPLKNPETMAVPASYNDQKYRKCPRGSGWYSGLGPWHRLQLYI